MSKWQAEKAERNRQSLARLNRALPSLFPPAVLSWALGRPFVPPTPRLAVDSYWRAHPIRADRLARALATRSGAPRGWTWQLGDNREQPHIERHRRPIANAYTRRVRDSAACAANRSIASVGMSICGERRQHECDLALRLCDRVAILERAERLHPAPAAAASATLRPERPTAVEERRS